MVAIPKRNTTVFELQDTTEWTPLHLVVLELDCDHNDCT